MTPEVNLEPAYVATLLAAIESQSENIKALQDVLSDLKTGLKANTLAIAKAVQFNSVKISQCKKDKQLEDEIKNLKEKNVQLDKRASELERGTAEIEIYKRTGNLRLKGLKEDKDEDTRELIVNLLLKIAPHWNDKMGFILDSVH